MELLGAWGYSMEQLLRRPDVEKRVGLGRSMIYKLMRTGDFPEPVRISARSVAWRESDVSAWIAGRTVTRGKPAIEHT